jgi:hypothetical protein
MQMRNLIYITIITALVGLSQFCGDVDHEKKQTSYPQELINALGKADALDLNTKIKTIKDALDSYYADHNEYPETLEMLMPEYLQTENALTDPWGTRFRLETDETGEFALISAAKDQTFGNTDDIKRRI